MKLNIIRLLSILFGVLMAACQTPLVTQKTPTVHATFLPSEWAQLPDWSTQNLAPSWPALQQSCRALKLKPQWQPICSASEQVNATDSSTQRIFYETWFTPYQVFNPDGNTLGMITGYYEPLLKGSRTKSERFRHPLYGVPEDLLEIDLSEIYPQFKGMRLRGKLKGKKIVPYYNRAEIDAGISPLKGHELFWVDNAVELFFLQVQGSGRFELEDGSQVKIGYAEQNGHPYVSIGKKLVEMGELKLEEVSMQGITTWAEKNPERLNSLLGQNP
ncbi:MAG: MltA domain-containing protein, partial [Gallionellaceae bacterium]|nr:MltA domain-containing protein [Gallionellaceae bacterium]